MYYGDFNPGDVFDFKFATVDGTGAPTALTSGAISVYKDNGTTESTAGVTLTSPFDARTGMHHVRITTVTDGTFYSAGSEFQVVITTGTVSGVSVVGYVLAAFSIQKRSGLRPATAGRTLVVSAGGVADANVTAVGGDAQSATDLKDFADAGYDPATNKVEGVKLADSLTLIAANGITATSLADGAIDAAALAADMDGYTGKLSVIDDDAGTADRWVMVWHKNGVPLSAGITSPLIQVVKLADNTDLVASTAMTQVGSTPFYQKVEATNRIVDGAAYGVIATATIGGILRTWTQTIGRPS